MTQRSLLPRRSQMTLSGWLMMIVLSVLWGGSYVFTAITIVALPPLTIALIRLGFAALLLHGVLWARGELLPARQRVWGALLFMGIFNSAMPISLIAWGQTHVTAGLASILSATAPLFGVLIAHFTTPDDKITLRRLLGIACGFLGVVVLTGPQVVGGIGDDLIGQFAVLGAALSAASASVFGRFFLRFGLTPLATAAGQVTTAALVLVPPVLWFDRPWLLTVPSLDVVAALLGLTLLSTALAYFLYFRVLAAAGATNTLLVGFLVPVSATILSHLLLDEHFAPRQLAGMALIGVGLGITDGVLVTLALLSFRSARSGQHSVRERS
ncbi:DMT family transporter [Arenibaculum pallidiluteum]|uniref:DMT family transporter n=1 Tax=Arenibaculum pallidiluteum TaxID=2812559 RepID=UPI001F344F0E|nr:DMT family transporter [Arenibaculum pallidiluteum]